MARRKLRIVVTCTDRKLAVPCDDLMARSLPAGTVTERADEWVGRSQRPKPTTRLLDLYKGESWTQAKRVGCHGPETGFDPERPCRIRRPGTALRRTTSARRTRRPSPAGTRTQWRPSPPIRRLVEASSPHRRRQRTTFRRSGSCQSPTRWPCRTNFRPWIRV